MIRVEREGTIARKVMSRLLRGIFVSYHRSDRTGAFDALQSKLEARYGRKRVTVDTADLVPGEPWRVQLMTAIKRSSAVIAVVGPTWAQEVQDPEDVGLVEIKAAMDAGLPIVPVLINQARMPDKDELPPHSETVAYVASLEAVDLRSGPDFERDMEPLLKWLDRHVTSTVRRYLLAGAAAAVLVVIVVALALTPGDGDAGPAVASTPPVAVSGGTTADTVAVTGGITADTVATANTAEVTRTSVETTAEETYRVVDIPEDDPDGGLNVRRQPQSGANNVVAVLHHDAAGIVLQDQRGTWARVAVRGWAFAEFLEPSTTGVPCPAGFDAAAVTGISEDDPDGGLNVRTEPRVLARNVVAVLRWNTAGLCADRVAEGDWRRVIVEGWVSSSYLAPDGA